MAATTMNRDQFVEWLRSEFPKLLQEDPRFSAEVVGILSQTLGSRAEFNRLLEEIRRLREDGERRFEAMERRFEAIDRRFEAIDRRFEAIDRRFEAIEHTLAVHSRILEEHSHRLEEHSTILREHSELLQEILRRLGRLEITVGGMADRRGRALEESVRLAIEEFSGVGPLRAERLVLTDTNGEVFGVPGQPIEFDCFVHDARRFLVEVKTFAKSEDVGLFFRKLQFAERQLREPFERVMIAPYARKRAVALARELGIQMLTFTEQGQK